eukprot:Amastigsp_a677007_5.p2 type:complete len:102 gc:universal Amastigsp_a677007_5:223-528(+)
MKYASNVCEDKQRTDDDSAVVIDLQDLARSCTAQRTPRKLWHGKVRRRPFDHCPQMIRVLRRVTYEGSKGPLKLLLRRSLVRDWKQSFNTNSDPSAPSETS